MNTYLRYLSLLITLAILSMVSCKPSHKAHGKEEIEAALKEYDRLIYKMDADSIAMMYTVDGDLGNIAHGRDSIRKFLLTFTNVKVLSTSSTSDTIAIDKDTARQIGRYSQDAKVEGDVIEARGSFRATWIWYKNEGWKIKAMFTKPDK